MTTPIKAVVFDVGGVLLDWSPYYLYRSLLPDDAAIEAFLAEVTTHEWNYQQDAGRPWPEAIAELIAQHPQHEALIRAYDERWAEMVSGTIEDTVAIFRELKAKGLPVYGLTNFSEAKWLISVAEWPILQEFDGVVVSGVERLVKPAPEIYELLLDRFGLEASSTFYIDDVMHNVEGARAVGMESEQFVGAATLREQLVARGVLGK
ncbi:HAD family hydrolase [Tenggerimyces flavus]|uniref:HAD family hydrolase n=1 Tax=Tenggerimyces flavus TaxID=1708749 RepID=A0ABV7YHI2_9ACTN|nr:HAD family phosphatase [Tenggerimyces flavus]MBM7787999.1 2-haloacid dehalogenase [Tenggerimyces flavus]